MARRSFYSFHYEPDNWRASQIRNMGVVDGNRPASDNDWETVKRGGESAIQRWIDSQLDGTSCTIVLIGAATAGRKWIEYEILKSWNSGKGVLGIYIHNLLNASGRQSSMGSNPFNNFSIKQGSLKLSSIVPVYNPPYTDSRQAYGHINSYIAGWIEDAIRVRNLY